MAKKTTITAALVILVVLPLALVGAFVSASDAQTAAVERIAGTDRFATAAEISHVYWEDQREVTAVYIANGTTMVDAVSAGATLGTLPSRGFLERGPLLLVTRDAIHPETRAELERLNAGDPERDDNLPSPPCRVVVFGGTSAVSDAVVADIQSYVDPNQAKC